MAPLSKNFRLILFSTALISIWGLGWPIIAMGLPYCPPICYSTLRLMIGAIIVFILMGLTGQLTLPDKRDLPLIFSVGFFQIGVFVMLITLGMEYVPPGRSAIIAYIFPYFVAPMAVIFFAEQLSFGKIAGLILGAMGIGLLFSPWELDWHNKNLLIGNGLLILAAFSWAVVMLHIRYATWHRAAHVLLPWQLLISIIPNLLMAIIFSPHPEIHFTSKFLFSISYTAVLCSGLAYWLLMIISRELPVITMSLLLLATPVVGLLSSALLMGEKLSISMIISVLFIITGLIFLFSTPSKKSSVINKM